MDKNFFENLKAAKQAATFDMDAFGPSARQLAGIAKVRGQERRVELINEYRKYLNEAGAAIILKGDDQTRFAHEAEKEGGTLTIDAEAVYLELFKGMYESMGGTGLFTINQLVALQNRLEQYTKRKSLEIFRMPTFNDTMVKNHANKEELFQSLRAELVVLLGTSILVSQVKNDMFTAAIAAETVEPVVPVVIVNAIESEIEGLVKSFNGRAIVVETTDEVVDVFKQLLTKLKGQ